MALLRRLTVLVFLAAAPVSAQQLRIAPRPALVIGELDGGAPYLFHRVRDARFASGGRIVVADGGSQSLRVFDRDGRFLHSMGGPGEGPGEFQDLDGLWMVSGDTVGAWDRCSYRFTYFTVDGDLVGAAPVRPPPGGPSNLALFAGALQDGSVVVGALAVGPEGRDGLQQDRATLLRFATDGTYTETLVEFGGLVRRRTERVGGPVAFSPFPYAAVGGDFVAFMDGAEPSVAVRRDDATVASFDVPVTAPDRDEAWTALRRRAEELPAFTEPFFDDPSDVPPPAIAGLLIDDRGRIWTKEFVPATDALWLRGGGAVRGGRWWVGMPGGAPPVAVAVPEGVWPVQVRDGRMMGVSVDEFGVERIVVYPLSER